MLELKNVSKIFKQPDGSSVEALRDITLQIQEREFVALVGPSGCGKTTLLKLIAGLESPTSGNITFNGEAIKSTNRERGMVFQDFALFPWLDVRENIAFGLRLQNIKESRIKKAVDHYLELAELERFRESYPIGLSGGMQQRVAIARTLANDPKILLMDEPFGALDVQTRSKMQEFLTRLWEKEHKTVVFVTHDIREAIFLADRVFLLSLRPATIKQEIKIDFPRPRTHELKFSDEFFNLERRLHNLFEPV